MKAWGIFKPSISCIIFLLSAVYLYLWGNIKHNRVALNLSTNQVYPNINRYVDNTRMNRTEKKQDNVKYTLMNKINKDDNIENDTLMNRTSTGSKILNQTQSNQDNTRIKILDSEVNKRNVFDKIDKPYVKVAELRLYIFSAMIDNTFDDKTPKRVMVHGWQHKSVRGSKITCCIMLFNGTILSLSGTSDTPFTYPNQSILEAKLYRCLFNADVKEIEGISIRINNSTCITDMKYYIKPVIKERSKHSGSEIGVCAKFVYGDIGATKLIEWFEVHRLFGVNNVIVYTYKLNNDACKVLEYYEKLGVVVIVRGYDEPEKDIYPREVGEKNPQVWIDEQVILMDCLTRLDGYKYVSVIDVDEYMVPNVNDFKGAWIHFFERMFSNYTAGITFTTQYHVTTWGPTNPSSKLFIGRYINTTGTILDRQKNVYMPSRVIQQYTTTHDFVAKKGFKRTLVHPNYAAIHHFRECRTEWLHPIDTNTSKYNPLLSGQKQVICFDFHRHRSVLLLHLAYAVEKNVTKIRDQLAFYKQDIS